MIERDSARPPRRTPLDARAMRQGNLALLLSTVVQRPSISQPELVEVTGLKKPTVSRLLDELVRLGWLRVSGAAAGQVGRPRVLVAPDPQRGVVLSARISIDSVSMLAVDFGGTERGQRVDAVPVREAAQADVAEALQRMAADLLADLGGSGRVLGAALALPGIVNDGRLGYAPGLEWPDRDVTSWLRSALGPELSAGTELVVGNEARFAAIAEQRYGAAAGVDDFVYLLGEAGVGAGVVADGRLFHGSRGAAGEVGHVSVDLDGRRCSCGKRGCWASYVGQGELVRRMEEARSENRKLSSWSPPGRSPAGPWTPQDVLAAAGAGDPVAVAALDVQRRYLAAGIGNLVSVYDPELVVLGGFLAAAFGTSLDRLRDEVDDWVMGGGIHTTLRLETSRVESASLWGGVALVHDALVQAPRPAQPA